MISFALSYLVASFNYLSLRAEGGLFALFTSIFFANVSSNRISVSSYYTSSKSSEDQFNSSSSSFSNRLASSSSRIPYVNSPNFSLLYSISQFNSSIFDFISL